MRNLKLIIISFLGLTALGISFSPVFAVYRQSEHHPLQTGAVEVTGPGNYDKPGVTYMLTRDISSPGSAIFLGKDVVLDLNGYTITFADGEYAHVPNYDFEEGIGGWDLSPRAGSETRIHG